MSGHTVLTKKLSEDDSLRQQIVDTPTRDVKQEAVRNAGLDVPDHHDVLKEVAGGTAFQSELANIIRGDETSIAAAAAAAAV